MKAIRLVINQNSANYRKEETSENKMTYPIPPFSTIIGAIHNACGWDTYHPMKVGVLGKFQSIDNRIFRANGYLDLCIDDRGVLVYMPNKGSISNAYETVAVSETRGSSFKKNQNISIKNQSLYENYIALDNKIIKTKEDKNAEMYPVTQRLNEIKDAKSKLCKDDELFQNLVLEEKNLKNKKAEINDKYKNIEKSINDEKSRYRCLSSSIKRVELLNDIKLIIYVVPENEEEIEIIKNNCIRISCLGRTEDYVDIESFDIVDLRTNEKEEELENDSSYNQYIDYELIKNNSVLRDIQSSFKQNAGTVYFIPKNYVIKDNKRVFEKKRVVFVSGFSIDENIENIYYDDELKKIVNLF